MNTLAFVSVAFAACLLCGVGAAPAKPVEVLEYVYEVDEEDDSYDLLLSLDNGHMRSEVGRWMELDDGSFGYAVTGHWSVAEPNGLFYETEFNANLDGYRAKFRLSQKKEAAG